MIEISIKGGEFTVLGHANAGPMGRDVVCAGVSAITQSVLNWCIQHSDDADAIRFNTNSGEFRMFFVPKKRLRREWEAVKEAALYGYCAIAAEFPQYVTVQ